MEKMMEKQSECKSQCDNCFAFAMAGLAAAFHAGQITQEEFHELMDQELRKDWKKQEAQGKAG